MMNWTGPRPTSPPLVTFAQMQAQLRIDDDDEQQYIADLVDAATEYAEVAMDTSLLQRTITAIYYAGANPVPYFNGSLAQTQTGLYLPRGPVQSIVSVTDKNGTPITDYQLQGSGTYDSIKINLPWAPPLTIVYIAGYGTLESPAVPSDIPMMIRMHVASWWRNRESISDRAMMAVPHNLESAYERRKRSPPIG
jgi:uncharacterized phiE125 gp8 family phage protein